MMVDYPAPSPERAVNPLVGGSNPSRGASLINGLGFFSVNLLRYARVGNCPRLPFRIQSPGRERHVGSVEWQ